jgi:antitoxin component YwqK of YwqJK toxin-antitoxin module
MKNFKFNGNLYGLNIRYSWNGDIMEKCYYKNNKREGEYKYYKNCKIWDKCYYKNDKRKGKFIGYCEDGNFIKCNYINGIIEGGIEYYENDNI